jgi:hypothetical protein
MSCRFWTVLALALLAAPAAAADVPAGVIAAINDARAHPQAYAAGLRAYRGYYHGRQVDAPDEAGTHLTREGVAAVDDAIAFLERQPPPTLTWPTPFICEMRCARLVEAMSYICPRLSTSDVSERIITGASAGFTLR